MLKRDRNAVRNIVRLVDAGIMVAAWFVSYWCRFFVPVFQVTKGLPEVEQYAALTPFVAILWMAVFSWMRVYESQRRLNRWGEIDLILRAHGVALLSFIAVTYLFDEYKYSRLVMAYFAIFGMLGIVLFRTILRSVLNRIRARGLSLRYVLAIGEGPALESVVRRLTSFPELGLHVRGIVTHEGSEIESICAKPVLGHFGELAEILHSSKVHEVYIALPASQYQELDQVLQLLKDKTIDVRLVPDLGRYVTLSCKGEDFDGIPVVRLNDSPISGWGALAKRVTDIIFSAIALVVLVPVLLVTATLVKLTSRGPVLYSQERMGFDGRTFKILKFRSMRVDAEAQAGAVWAQAVDERRTAFGRFLRETSLDELPQFWNVLRGDMSLVGPRPERPVFVHRFRSEVPLYMLRHKVKAGITGWAQVNGWRGNTSLDRRIECDLFYIRHWSYMLDIKILFTTLWKGFINKNAY